MKILIVEDSEHLNTYLKKALQRAGYEVDSSLDGAEGLWMAESNAYDLSLLDVMLPNVDGFTILQRLRQQEVSCHILMLTAKDQLEDRIHGLDSGADDYLIKPVDLRELSARCRALIRRNSGEVASLVNYGNLSFNRGSATVLVNDTEVDLPKRELSILDLLLSHQGRTLSKSQIADQLCSFDDIDELPSDNAIELYIARLRKKIAASNVRIKTLRGIGHMIYVEQ
mgnify:CR=1 FL=1